MNSSLPRTGLRLFAALAVVALIAIAVAVLVVHRERSTAALREQNAVQPAVDVAETRVPETRVVPADAAVLEGPAQSGQDALPSNDIGSRPVPIPPRIFFRNTTLNAMYGRLAYRDGPQGKTHFAAQLSCEVAYVSHAAGICLVAKRGVVTRYLGQLFSATDFGITREFPLQGTPSRNRVSKDGHLAAYTVFLTGHGYSSLDFSTQTVILDTKTGEPIADLEHDFTVTRDGGTIKEQDFNFWGVTFPDSPGAFYATLSTAGKHYLVRGDLQARSMTVIHENVECPSVSPDGLRIAYKKRLNEGGRVLWQLQILDLASGTETALAERRSIDDQLEWLDNGSVLYSVPSESQDMGGGTDIWVADAQGNGKPRLFIANAYSPSVVRR